MKIRIFCFLVSLFCQNIFGQNGSVTPKGIVYPTFTNANRPTGTISAGTMIFNTTTGKHQFWTGIAWSDLCTCGLQKSTFYVQGRNLYDPCGNQIILRGVNKMNVWTDDTGASFSEITKTGANCVRIVWLISNGGVATNDVKLDSLIARCIRQKMIPIIELHDATCDWSGLQNLVNYWKRPAILSIINKYKNALLINIGNEVGDYLTTYQQFEDGYKSAIAQMRTAGIKVPLIVDAISCGGDIDAILQRGQNIVNSDTAQNILLSVHTYWPMRDSPGHLGSGFGTLTYITTKLQAAVAANLPLIVGEFSSYGAWNNNFDFCQQYGQVNYQWIATECKRLGIGWLAWEWGPGNIGGGNPNCTVMDMTTASTFATLQGWGLDIANNTNYGLITAQKSTYILNGFKNCN